MLLISSSSCTLGFEAMKAYEDHCRANGQPPSHAMAKESVPVDGACKCPVLTLPCNTESLQVSLPRRWTSCSKPRDSTSWIGRKVG
jgi:hypothetical protein